MALQSRILGPLLAMSLLAAGPARSADPGPRLPKKGPTTAAFVPASWSTERSVEGDLDKDGKPDAALILLEGEQPNGERRRVLVALLRRGGGYELAGSNPRLLPCSGCAGVKEGVDLEIERGTLLVHVYGGSREMWGNHHRLRWNKARGHFELIGQDSSSGDSLTGAGEETSWNVLTGDQFTKKTPAQVDEEGNPLQVPPEPIVKREKLPRKTPPLLEELEGE